MEYGYAGNCGSTSYAIFGARNYGERSPMQRIPAILSAWSATETTGLWSQNLRFLSTGAPAVSFRGGTSVSRRGTCDRRICTKPLARRTRGSTTASPQLGSCCFGDFLAANSTGHQTTDRGNWLTPSLPTPLFQMAIQSAEAQTSTLAKLAPPHTAAHKLNPQLLNLRTGTSPGR
jgi:hypothetical protein